MSMQLNLDKVVVGWYYFILYIKGGEFEEDNYY